LRSFSIVCIYFSDDNLKLDALVMNNSLNCETSNAEDFSPWVDNYSIAIGLASASIMFLWLSVALNYFFHSGKLVLILISLATFGTSCYVFYRGTVREFGKSFEQKWVKKANVAFQESSFTIGKSRMTKGGDIDLLVECPENKIINVEIKSWCSFGGDDKYAKREKKGISQIHAQRGAIGAEVSVLWLPQGRTPIFGSIFGGKDKIDDETYLCKGNAVKLRKLIERINSKF